MNLMIICQHYGALIWREITIDQCFVHLDLQQNERILIAIHLTIDLIDLLVEARDVARPLVEVKVLPIGGASATARVGFRYESSDLKINLLPASRFIELALCEDGDEGHERGELFVIKDFDNVGLDRLARASEHVHGSATLLLDVDDGYADTCIKEFKLESKFVKLNPSLTDQSATILTNQRHRTVKRPP